MEPKRLNAWAMVTPNGYIESSSVRRTRQQVIEHANNDWTRIVESHSPWKWTQPLHENDVVLEPAPALQSEERDNG